LPELPEVETVARGLRAALPGRRVLQVRLGKTDFIDDPVALDEKLPGSRVQGVRRLGKFLVLDLERANGTGTDSKLGLLIHLGMTGQIVTCPPETPVAPHTHAFLSLDDGRELRYRDIRRFGRIAILPENEQATVLGKLGLEPLEASQEEFSARVGGRRARVKALLLDQRVLRGM
jgi:formamidopyrimidine-DNA glycosylase